MMVMFIGFPLLYVLVIKSGMTGYCIKIRNCLVGNRGSRLSKWLTQQIDWWLGTPVNFATFTIVDQKKAKLILRDQKKKTKLVGGTEIFASSANAEPVKV